MSSSEFDDFESIWGDEYLSPFKRGADKEECLAIVPYTGGHQQQVKKDECWAIVPYTGDGQPIREGIPLPVAPPKPKRGRPKREPNLHPAWLPAGWTIVKEPRTTGANPGHVDSYYINTALRVKCRSRNEMEYYISNGRKRAPKQKVRNPKPGEKGAHGNETLVEGGPSKKRKRVAVPSKKQKKMMTDAPPIVSSGVAEGSTDDEDELKIIV